MTHTEYMREWRKTEKGRACEKRAYLKKKTRPWFYATARRAADKYRKSQKGIEYHRRAARKWRANNPEKVRLLKAAYHRANREAIIASVRDWQMANPEKVSSYKMANKARRKGAHGRHSGANIQLLCQSCNLRKHKKTNEEFMRLCRSQ